MQAAEEDKIGTYAHGAMGPVTAGAKATSIAIDDANAWCVFSPHVRVPGVSEQSRRPLASTARRRCLPSRDRSCVGV